MSSKITQILNFAQIGQQIGDLVERKNAAYGSSVAVAGDFLRLLYPDGLQPHQYAHALLLVRIFDKQKRIATDADAFGESPFADIAGYGILGAHMHQSRKASEPCSSVSGPDAPASSAIGQSDIAESSTRPQHSPNANETTEQSISPRPNATAARTTSAPAPTATEAASANAADLRQGLELVFAQLVMLMRRCNSHQLCARCGNIYASKKSGASVMGSVWGENFVVCSDCADDFPQWRQRLEMTRRFELPRSEEDRRCACGHRVVDHNEKTGCEICFCVSVPV